MENELEKVKDDHPKPSRLLRSQQVKKINSVEEISAGDLFIWFHKISVF